MAKIFVRSAELADLPAIMAIIAEAKELLKKDGSPQWQDGNPSEATLRQDIVTGVCQVLVLGDSIVGTAALLTEPDPNYRQIFAGSWQNTTDPYATIHRIAITATQRGQQLGRFFLANLLSLAYAQGLRNLRIDTHEMNQRMQHLVTEFDFVYRGIVYVAPNENGKRLAYELNLAEA